MKQGNRKQLRLRLEPEAYRRLARTVLARDGWRCQHCGVATNLEAHHLVPRSRLGGDIDENLITLCARCHRNRHGHGAWPV
jgi:5-methylcytosine-specific restriction endonuclease McrA